MTGSTVGFELVDLDERGRQAAMTLFAKNIPSVTRSHIDDGTFPQTRACVEFFRALAAAVGHDVLWWPHQWIGIYCDGRLAGAVHASAKLYEGAEAIRRCRTIGPPMAPSPRWIERFLNTVLSIEEIAVHPQHRHRGIATSLMEELHTGFRDHVARFAAYADEEGLEFSDQIRANVVTHASPAAQPLFASLGYTVGPPRTPIPPEYMSGMKTIWAPVHNNVDGAFCYRHLAV